jgi:hypothetical protein
MQEGHDKPPTLGRAYTAALRSGLVSDPVSHMTLFGPYIGCFGQRSSNARDWPWPGPIKEANFAQKPHHLVQQQWEE